MDLALIAEILEEMGIGTRGVDLFIHNMPASVNEGVVVLSQMPVEIRRYSTVRMGTFQIIARATDAESALAKMNQISGGIQGEGIDLESVYVYYILPKHEPLIFPRSGADQIEVSVNFDIAYMPAV